MDKYDNILRTLSQEPQWSSQNESDLLEPFTYTTANPGKEIRGKLIEAFNLWLKVPPEELSVIAKIVNMLHTASLMVDDIEDDSQLRRGQPVAHKIYGIPQTINSANYAYFLAYQQLFALRQNSKASDLDALVTSELLSLHRGQGLEILWRDSLRCPTEDEYIQMVNNKTGGLLRIGIRLMMACATENTDIDYIPLVNLIGIFFQIRDDLMNLQSTEYTTNKGFAEDLTEGKFSFPVVHGIHTDNSNRQVLNVLQKRPTTPTLKIHTISYLRDQTKSFEYTLSVLENLEAQTRREIKRLGGSGPLEKLMDLLHVDPAKFAQ
ncbi:terpenoid synthase [Macrolepiota fuliginosa MF-IS2]|uniref:(2E,6E)-farnesyl diphosphate synthase n=1 Tax=Macrolepiota fuliginosa MF-IS2 TaxID=1400762 RepID=A0A9P5XDA6_9AGAR|nr:terpenoid synthase [Macrolepiota fuliginosa MF-IS2]